MQLHGAFLLNIKYFRYKVGIQLNSTDLVVELNNYATKIVNSYIIYAIDNWPKIPPTNFMHKKLFSATNIVKGSDNEKHVYSNYGVSFDGTGEGKYLVMNLPEIL